MSSRTMKIGGSPVPRPTKNPERETAKGIGTVNVEKLNLIPGDLLARTIAHRPPNEDRIRGLAA